MRYSYPKTMKTKAIFAVLIAVLLLSNLSVLKRVFSGDINVTVILSFSPVFILLLLWMANNFYIKIFSITTNEEGLIFQSLFKKVYLDWDEIKIVEKIGWNIRILSSDKKLTVSPSIKSVEFKSGKKHYNKTENIFRKCELLQEIYLKAKNAKFKNFPEGTFDEIRRDKLNKEYSVGYEEKE